MARQQSQGCKATPSFIEVDCWVEERGPLDSKKILTNIFNASAEGKDAVQTRCLSDIFPKQTRELLAEESISVRVHAV